MCMTNEATSDASAVEKHLVDKLQEMLRESSDEKLWPHKLFNSVSIYDIVILSAQQGRGVIELWLWCQSQEALERLRDIDEGELIKITEQLFSRFQSSTILKPQTASIDSNYFVYDVVVRPMSEKLRGFLLCPFDKNSFGRFSVSSLQDKIYATSDRTTIYIYEDKAPYTQLECKINLPPSRMRNPLELAACQVNRCLYIVDRAENCIWKMNPADNYELKKWLSEPLPKLSVSSDGKVFLILDNDRTNPQLRVYTSDAELESTIPLRGDSYMYSWTAAAVELKPGVVAVQYEKFGPRGMLKGISIMRLNETGDILRDVECERSFRLVPYSAGRLIAVDQDENKVILLDDQLKPLQVILSNENRGSEWPRCFCYRKDTRELIVNHFGGGVVSGHYQFDVYKLSFSDD